MKISTYSRSLTSMAAVVAMAFCPGGAPAQNAPEIDAFIAGIDGFDNYDDPVISTRDFSGGRELPQNVLPESGSNDFAAPNLAPQQVDAPESAAVASDAQTTAGSDQFVSDYFDKNYYVDPDPIPARTWVLGITVPILRREFDGNRLFSVNPADVTQTLSSNDADPRGSAGIDINFARRSSSGLGFEVRYLGLYPSAANAVLGGTPTTAINGLSQLLSLIHI